MRMAVKDRALDTSSETLERTRIREVAAVFHSRSVLDDAVEDLLLNGFDRADIDHLASVDEVNRRLRTYVAAEDLADLPSAPREPPLTRDDIAIVISVTSSVIGGAAALAVVGTSLAAGANSWWAAGLGIVVGLTAGSAAGVLLTRVFRRDERRGLEWIENYRGRVLWVRVRSPEREDLAQSILRRRGGTAIRVHEVELAKRVDDLPLSKLRPDPWLGSEPLGHL